MNSLLFCLGSATRLNVARRLTWALLLAMIFGGAGSAHAQVVAMIYGSPITALDIQQRANFEQLAGSKITSRKDILDVLINDKLKVREGKRYGIEASDEEVDQAYSQMADRMRTTPDKLNEILAARGTRATVVKSRIRSDLVWQRLVRGRYASTLAVGEQDVLASLTSDKPSDEPQTSYEFGLRPILFIVPDGAAPAVYEARKREAEALRGRFVSCDTGLSSLRALHDVAVRTQIVRNSVDMPADLRKILDGMSIGHLTEPQISKHGVEMFALCNKTETRADSAAKKEARDTLFMKKYEEKSQQYLNEIRRSAMIEYK